MENYSYLDRGAIATLLGKRMQAIHCHARQGQHDRVAL